MRIIDPTVNLHEENLSQKVFTTMINIPKNSKLRRKQIVFSLYIRNYSVYLYENMLLRDYHVPLYTTTL